MYCQAVNPQISEMNLVNKIMTNRNDNQNYEYKIQASITSGVSQILINPTAIKCASAAFHTAQCLNQDKCPSYGFEICLVKNR